MGNLDDLKDELEFDVAMNAPRWISDSQQVRDAVEVGFLQLDAGATYGEALAAAKMRLKEAA